MYKGLYTILITINIVTVIIIISLFFFWGALGYQFYYFQMLPSLNKVLPTLPTRRIKMNEKPFPCHFRLFISRDSLSLRLGHPRELSPLNGE